MQVMCMQYWPASKDLSETHGGIKISILKEEELANFHIRIFRLVKKEGGEFLAEMLDRQVTSAADVVRDLIQFHYTQWHSHTCPFSNAILEFRRRVRSVVGTIQSDLSGPMVVHCNDGGGRSGVYLAVDANMELMEEEDAFDDQYKFVYDTLEEFVSCGNSWFPVKELSARLKQKSIKNPLTKINEYQHEYQLICKQTPRFTIGDCAGGHRADNREKNRDVLIVPPDNFRPYLTSFQGNNFTDYINAVFVDLTSLGAYFKIPMLSPYFRSTIINLKKKLVSTSWCQSSGCDRGEGEGYTKPREYIVTEWPLKNTCGEFWSLVYDYECSAVVVLCVPPLNSDSKQIHRRSIYVSGDDHRKIVSLTELMAGVKAPPRTVQLFQLGCWPMGHKVPTSTNSLVELMNMVERWRQRTDYGPVTVGRAHFCPTFEEKHLLFLLFGLEKKETIWFVDVEVWIFLFAGRESHKLYLVRLEEKKKREQKDKDNIKNKSEEFQANRKGLENKLQEAKEAIQKENLLEKDGRGRCGVYCAANACIEQVIQHGEVDVFQAVKTVRRHRPQLVENMTEYKYCYDLVLHYVLHYLNKDMKEKNEQEQLWYIDFGRGSALPQTPEEPLLHSDELAQQLGARKRLTSRWNCCSCELLSPCCERSHAEEHPLPSPTIDRSLSELAVINTLPVYSGEVVAARRKQPHMRWKEHPPLQRLALPRETVKITVAPPDSLSSPPAICEIVDRTLYSANNQSSSVVTIDNSKNKLKDKFSQELSSITTIHSRADDFVTNQICLPCNEIVIETGSNNKTNLPHSNHFVNKELNAQENDLLKLKISAISGDLDDKQFLKGVSFLPLLNNCTNKGESINVVEMSFFSHPKEEAMDITCKGDTVADNTNKYDEHRYVNVENNITRSKSEKVKSFEKSSNIKGGIIVSTSSDLTFAHTILREGKEIEAETTRKRSKSLKRGLSHRRRSSHGKGLGSKSITPRNETDEKFQTHIHLTCDNRSSGKNIFFEERFARQMSLASNDIPLNELHKKLIATFSDSTCSDFVTAGSYSPTDEHISLSRRSTLSDIFATGSDVTTSEMDTVFNDLHSFEDDDIGNEVLNSDHYLTMSNTIVSGEGSEIVLAEMELDCSEMVLDENYSDDGDLVDVECTILCEGGNDEDNFENNALNSIECKYAKSLDVRTERITNGNETSTNNLYCAATHVDSVSAVNSLDATDIAAGSNSCTAIDDSDNFTTEHSFYNVNAKSIVMCEQDLDIAAGGNHLESSTIICTNKNLDNYEFNAIDNHFNASKVDTASNVLCSCVHAACDSIHDVIVLPQNDRTKKRAVETGNNHVTTNDVISSDTNAASQYNELVPTAANTDVASNNSFYEEDLVRELTRNSENKQETVIDDDDHDDDDDDEDDEDYDISSAIQGLLPVMGLMSTMLFILMLMWVNGLIPVMVSVPLNHIIDKRSITDITTKHDLLLQVPENVFSGIDQLRLVTPSDHEIMQRGPLLYYLGIRDQEGYIHRKCTHTFGEGAWKTNLSRADRDSILDLPVIGRLVYCKSSASKC
uniref:Uncharacterized protein n=1 Tax=Timema douglasi TaxID=61478 RepID=A0A7R8VE26_TIMDO|nr:unnamed protein product [Timema douglasi]